MPKILITGHRGFVGRHFVKRLHDQGDITGIDIVEGNDARDFFRHNDSHFDIVIHLAALVGGRKTIEGSPIAVANDLSIDAEFFNWTMKTRPGQIIYFSSSAAYPIDFQTIDQHFDLIEGDIDLNNLMLPDMTYGWAKLTGEMLAEHTKAAGIITRVFRPFSGYGSDQALDYPFPSFIQRARLRSNPFEVWGDGTQVRDFIHIDDIIDAVIASIRDDWPQTPYNLGTGIPTSFNLLASMCINIAGWEYPGRIKHLPAEPTGVHYRVADVELLNEYFVPRISLEEGIERALADTP